MIIHLDHLLSLEERKVEFGIGKSIKYCKEISNFELIIIDSFNFQLTTFIKNIKLDENYDCFKDYEPFYSKFYPDNPLKGLEGSCKKSVWSLCFNI